MLSATLTFAQTHHCDITETILCCWEVANPSKAKGEIRPRWHVKDTLNTVIFMRKQYHLIIMRDQNPPPPMTNMLNGLTTRHPLWPICWIGQLHQHYLHEGTKSTTPYDQYAERANNINLIFMRDQNSPPPQNNMLIWEITSILFSRGIKISHPLWTISWLRDINSGQTSRLQRTCFIVEKMRKQCLICLQKGSQGKRCCRLLSSKIQMDKDMENQEVRKLYK